MFRLGENEQQEMQGNAKTRVSVSVIIPTLNEAINLPLVLPFIPLDEVDEVILVDGRSKDGTVSIAKQLLPSIKIILEEKPGKGLAMRRGYEAATGDILIVLDADGSNDPREIPRFIRALLEGADFVKGSRFAPQGGTTDMPRIRKLGNGAFVKITNILFDTNFSDLCYGYHAFWRYCLDVFDLSKVDGFEIDTAIYLQALRNHLRIVDIPSFEGYRFYGSGKLQTIPDGWRVLKTIWHEWRQKSSVKPHCLERGFRGVKPRSLQMSEPVNNNALREWYLVNPVEQKLEQLRAFLKLLRVTGDSYQDEIDIHSLSEHVLRLSIENFGAMSGSILLINDYGRVIDRCSIFQDEPGELADTTLGVVVEKGLAGWVLKNQQPTVVSNTREDPRWLRQPWENKLPESRSALGIPLKIDRRVFGVMTLVGSQANQFSEDDLFLINQVLTTPDQEPAYVDA
ncbi:MAG: glycosyltransferase [Omnitrophica WOR_2 bacterium]